MANTSNSTWWSTLTSCKLLRKLSSPVACVIKLSWSTKSLNCAAAKAAGTKCDRSTVAKCKVLKCVRELKFDDEHFVELRTQCIERVLAIEAVALSKPEKSADTVQVTA